MIYRYLGNTGLKVSEIGLGCEGFHGQNQAFADEIFALALAHGVNYLDLYSPNPEIHRQVGKALGIHRKDFIFQAHLCTVWQEGQYKATRDIQEVKTAFEAMVANLGTEYIDVGMIHYVDAMDTWQNIAGGEIMTYARALKEQGSIHHIGLSSHNPLVALEAVKSGLIEVLMFSVNPCYDLLPGDEDVETLWAEESYAKPLFNLDPVREELYETCQRMGIGISVMKVFGGGDLLSADSPAGVAMTVPQCIHYALDRPGVATVLSGFHSAAELKQALDYETATEEEKDYAAAFAAFPKISWQGHCMYCGHCAPCAKSIDIAMVTKLLNLAKAQGETPETVREHYHILAAHAEDCIGCGACETRCPFGVPIRENMAAAKELFGK